MFTPTKLFVAKVEDGKTTLERECPLCGVNQTVVVDSEGLQSWNQKGELIQVALPTLTPDEAETLITGLCPPCSDELIGEEI